MENDINGKLESITLPSDQNAYERGFADGVQAAEGIEASVEMMVGHTLDVAESYCAKKELDSVKQALGHFLDLYNGKPWE